MNSLEITPLGTVSPYPKGERNCPSFLVKYKNHKILLDCGNGITRLLKFPEDLENLSVVINHYHNDHFNDISAIQYASYVYHNLGLLEDKVKVYLPKNDFNFNKKTIIGNKNSYTEYIDISDNSEFIIDDLKLLFYDNKSHDIESYMTKLENNYFKVIYTSDMGITNMEEAALFSNNADLLICESSFLEKHNSMSKTHMTVESATKLAKMANAKKLILTHFWPEEDKVEYLQEAKEYFENVDVAEEGKKVLIKQNLK